MPVMRTWTSWLGLAVGTLAFLAGVTAAHAAEPPCPAPPVLVAGIEVGNHVGQRAPDFSLPDLSGNPVSLSSFHGCPVLLDFWASWCKPCQVSVPLLESFRQRYAPRGLKVIAVSLDYRKEDATRFLEAYGYRGFIALWAPFTEARAVAYLFGIQAIPRTVLLDRQGIIRFIGPPQDLTDDLLAPWL
ncbi:MAG: TlpA family protein disulfide reductase [Candidatus Bipolaricaulis sp.]